MSSVTYKLRSKVWLYTGMAGWHFVDVSRKVSKEIKGLMGTGTRGFGSVPVNVTAGKTKWKTSIFPDTKRDCYIMPLKVSVRKAEGIKAGSTLQFSINIQL